MRVVDIMTRNAISCTEFCTAHTAANLLKQSECGVVPVLNGTSREVVGVITERSVCLRVVALRCDPATIPVSECMDVCPAICRPEDDAYAVLAKIGQSRSRGATVVSASNELEGVLSLSTLAIRVSIAAQELYAALRDLQGKNTLATTV